MGASRSKVAGEALRNYVACFERSGEQVADPRPKDPRP